MENDAVDKVGNFVSELNAGNASNAANAQDAANNSIAAGEKVDENLDMLLSDIGEILEEDAAAFVQGFVQKGGE
ncbi:ubiquitin-like protein Pup [uncultured Arcanobacterium sp.]|uniref:ubiquitin-like protein Pup n=1 Tax=uncultured Arcanobacterium sp. TaxID=487520 RepID=UPI00262E397B|nr:ubiquitin-like protein Pup [uncultured Arcanobacterium sp.]